MPLRVVLMGTGEFALPVFRAVITETDHDVAGLYTQPEKTGRGHHRHRNPVKELALENGVPVFQPPNVNAAESLQELRALKADVFVVAAYGQILKPDFLAIPPLGAFNLHGSLLPRHRGAAPVQYSIWRGDSEAGVTMFQIEPALDSGPMIAKVSTPIGPEETSGELMQRLAELSIPLTMDALNQLEAGTAVFEPQDGSLVTLAPKIRKEQGCIDWARSAAAIDCHVRAMQPWPRAFTWLHSNGRKSLRCLILSLRVTEDSPAAQEPGQIAIRHGRLCVAAGTGMAEVLSIQPDGKKAMDATAFVNGYGISSEACFGPPSEDT